MSSYRLFIDVSDDGMYAVITKTNDFVSKVIAVGPIDDLIKKAKRYKFKSITISEQVTRDQLNKIRKLIKD